MMQRIVNSLVGFLKAFLQDEQGKVRTSVKVILICILIIVAALVFFKTSRVIAEISAELSHGGVVGQKIELN